MIWTSPLPPLPPITTSVYDFVMEKIDKEIQEDSNKPALISASNGNNKLTFQQLKYKTQRVEAFLHKCGFLPGDVASTVMSNSMDIIPFFLRVLGRGGIFSGIKPLFTKGEIRTMIEGNDVKVILTTTDLLDLVLSATKEIHLKAIICIGPKSDEKVYNWEEDVMKTEGIPPPHQSSLDDVVTMLYSSGTTGLPEAVLVTNYNYISAILISQINYIHNISPKVFPSLSEEAVREIWKKPQLLQMPMHHLYGNFIFLLFLSMGAPSVIMETFDLPSLLAKIEEYKILNLFLSPPMVLQLTKESITDGYDLSSLRYANNSAAPLGKQLADDFVAKFPHVKIAQGLGMSEALCAFVNDFGDNDLPFGILGSGYEAKIVCPTGKPQGVNCPGEILVRGPGVMKGYYKNPKATSEAIDNCGWYRTGDAGFFNEKGRLFVLDRLKELIKVEGCHVAPAEIEDALVSDRRIRDAAVIGIPHETKGEVPTAFIVKNTDDLTEADVQNVVKEKLAAYKCLTGGVVFLKEIPRLPSGKILRRQLRERFISNKRG